MSRIRLALDDEDAFNMFHSPKVATAMRAIASMTAGEKEELASALSACARKPELGDETQAQDTKGLLAHLSDRIKIDGYGARPAGYNYRGTKISQPAAKPAAAPAPKKSPIDAAMERIKLA
jgi:hypothetical protein